jgi:hypothetical protein
MRQLQHEGLHSIIAFFGYPKRLERSKARSEVALGHDKGVECTRKESNLGTRTSSNWNGVVSFKWIFTVKQNQEGKLKSIRY